MKRALTLLLMCGGLAACETNPVSGRSQFVIVSEQQAQASSTQAYAQTLSAAEKQGKISRDAALNARVRRLFVLSLRKQNRQYAGHLSVRLRNTFDG